MFFGVLFLGLGFYVAWGFGNGYVTYSKPSYECFGGRHPVADGDKVPYFSIGYLSLKYQPLKWDCSDDHKYDPAVYHVVDGLIEAK